MIGDELQIWRTLFYSFVIFFAAILDFVLTFWLQLLFLLLVYLFVHFLIKEFRNDTT